MGRVTVRVVPRAARSSAEVDQRGIVVRTKVFEVDGFDQQRAEMRLDATGSP